MNKLRVSHEAGRDLREIKSYLSKHASEETAIAMVARILRSARALRKHPMLGRAREDAGHGCRSLVEAGYVIYYRPVDIGIELLHVIHGRRDQSQALKPKDE